MKAKHNVSQIESRKTPINMEKSSALTNQHSAGKGDKYRPVRRQIYEQNWQKIFGPKKVVDKHLTPSDTEQ